VSVSGSAGPPGTTESPQSEATPFSTPDPIPSKGCPAPPHDAIVTQAVTPDRPQSAVNEDAVGRVVVEVQLTREGSVAHASVRASSGFAALDRAAVGAATQARYAPASDGCEAIAGTYLYVVDFSE
jgi:protein TonB